MGVQLVSHGMPVGTRTPMGVSSAFHGRPWALHETPIRPPWNAHGRYTKTAESVTAPLWGADHRFRLV